MLGGTWSWRGRKQNGATLSAGWVDLAATWPNVTAAAFAVRLWEMDLNIKLVGVYVNAVLRKWHVIKTCFANKDKCSEM